MNYKISKKQLLKREQGCKLKQLPKGDLFNKQMIEEKQQQNKQLTLRRSRLKKKD